MTTPNDTALRHSWTPAPYRLSPPSHPAPTAWTPELLPLPSPARTEYTAPQEGGEFDARVREQVQAQLDRLKREWEGLLDLKDTIAKDLARGLFANTPDGRHIPEWLDGIDRRVNEVSLQVQVVRWNLGDAIDVIPTKVGDVSPDLDVRWRCLRAAQGPMMADVDRRVWERRAPALVHPTGAAL